MITNNFYYVCKGKNEDWFENINGRFKEKVKLVYMDPPYNTKRSRGARKSYSDNNSDWKKSIYEVIDKSFNYLREDGFLAISINQTELFSLKNEIDRVFNKKGCFVGLFPIKIRHSDRQLMIGASFHDIYEYLLIYRKNPKSQFNTTFKKPDLNDYYHEIRILDNSPKIMEIKGKKAEVYSNKQYEIISDKSKTSKEFFRKYSISGKIATANWSGEFYENNLKHFDNNCLIKIHGLENHGKGYRWFETPNEKRKRGIYFQSFEGAGRKKQVSNGDFDYTDEVTLMFKEGGEGIDFKDSKKPEKLINKLIEITTSEEDIVFDLFGGSGTTIASCVKKNRNCLTIEMENVKIIQKRLENLKKGEDIDKKIYDFDYKLFSDLKEWKNEQKI
ncbi:MAG: DNA methyltransferase [Candidatus Nanoarchaeia archaeon]